MPPPGAPQQKISLPNIRYVVAVASGKGGVGKSTVAANLALALKMQGNQVGLMDADIYGPSVPIMMGIPPLDPKTTPFPMERYGIKLMSMGFVVPPSQAVIWRGPMVHKAVSQFLTDIDWGPLDYLVIDLPPGTGDAQLTLTQTAPLSGAVIVTTPQEVSDSRHSGEHEFLRRRGRQALRNLSSRWRQKTGRRGQCAVPGRDSHRPARGGVRGFGTTYCSEVSGFGGGQGVPCVGDDGDGGIAKGGGRSRAAGSAAVGSSRVAVALTRFLRRNKSADHAEMNYVRLKRLLAGRHRPRRVDSLLEVDVPSRYAIATVRWSNW
jgi:hypothetical protein